MDINLALLQLGPNTSEYRLSQTPPPHTIIEWRGPGSSQQTLNCKPLMMLGWLFLKTLHL